MIIGVKVDEKDVRKLEASATKLKNLASQFKDKIESTSKTSEPLQAEKTKKQLNDIINTVNEIKEIFEKCYPFIDKDIQPPIYPNPYTPSENPYFIPRSPYPDPTCPDWSKMNQTWCNSNPKGFGGGTLYDEDQKNSRAESDKS